MNDFLQTALTFPTVIYSVLLTVCAAYWLLAATGLADGDAVDAATGGDGDAGTADGAAAMLARLGLGGVPVTIVATTLVFAAWIGTYFVQLLALRHLPEATQPLAGAAAMVGMLVPAVAVTSIALRPLSRVIVRLNPGERPLAGQTAVLITPALTGDYGQASVDDGGAGLILQVRHDDPNPLQRGDRVVLIDPIEGQNAWRVVPEQQFFSR